MATPSSDVFLPSGGGSVTGGKLFGLPKPVVYVGAAVGAYVAYRYFKNRSSSTSGAPAVTMPACADGSTADPITGLCQNGLYPGQLVAYPGQAGTQAPPGSPVPNPPVQDGPNPTPTPTPQPYPLGYWEHHQKTEFGNNIWLYWDTATQTWLTVQQAEGMGVPAPPSSYQPGQEYPPGSYTPSGGAGPAVPTGGVTAQAAAQPSASVGQAVTSLTSLQTSAGPLSVPGQTADFRSAVLGGGPGGAATQAHVLPSAAQQPPSFPGLPLSQYPGAVTHGSGVELSGGMDPQHLYLAGQNAAMRNVTAAPITGNGTGARNWFGPPGPPQKQPGHGPHWEGPPLREPRR